MLDSGIKLEVSILPSDRNALRRELRERFPRNHGQLLPALHYLHHEFGHLPDWAMEVVGWHLGIPSSEVYGAATSYTELRIEEPGASVVRVCTALSCVAAGITANSERSWRRVRRNSRRNVRRPPPDPGTGAVRFPMRYGAGYRGQRQVARTSRPGVRPADRPGSGHWIT